MNDITPQCFYIPEPCQKDRNAPRVIFGADRGWFFVRTVFGDYKPISLQLPPYSREANRVTEQILKGKRTLNNVQHPDGNPQTHRYTWDGQRLHRIKGQYLQ